MTTRQVARHILLTGPPGIGKTTLIHKVCDHLTKSGVQCKGFYTEERREGRHRVGFDVVTLSGERAPLASVNTSDVPQGRQYTVGKYVVQLQSFETAALPTLRKKEGQHNIFVIDEIGKMELFSQTFARLVRDLLGSENTTVIATIPIAKGRPIPLVEEVRQRSDAVLFNISQSNRDAILGDIISAVMSSVKRHGS
ncbi:cancer-related nucleoside-triphosphatase-like [Mizuhopecten yessoensis]|uniref:cancer-related nucleoside-triphosphatase-like n=1 Tax=Mizuhopecten yessoensis TaxID=6573 RepID=UPI000B459FA0|nr:cancer-related nucleoside-triphosphatase-like [Mizuhopecten yessoensis]